MRTGFIKVENGAVVGDIRPRPKWHHDDEARTPVTDEAIFIEGGYYPVEHDAPAHDPVTQSLGQLEPEDWVIHEDHVEVTFEVTDKTQEEIDDYWRSRVNDRAEKKFSEPVPVTDASGGAHEVNINDRHLATIKPLRERAEGADTTKPFPTRGGVKEFNGADLKSIEDAIDQRYTDVLRKKAELEEKIDDGTITQADIDGW